MMVRRLAWLFILPGLLFGQFHNLATTDDGGLLMFSSALTLRGTDEFSWDKLFSIDSGGLSLYAQRQRVDPVSPGSSALSNYYLMQDADLSGDGTVRALITGRVCVLLGSTCFLGASKIQSEVSGLPGQGTVLLRGQIRMSRSGRYALLCCDGSVTSQALLMDLNTGAAKNFSASPGLSHRMVASTGTAVLPTRQKTLLVATLDGTESLPTSAITTRAVIDDGALNAFYEGQPVDGGSLLARVDLRAGTESILVTASDLTLVGTSNDGQTVAFLSDAKLTTAETGGLTQLFSVRADGTSLRQVTQDLAGIVEATLAGNGTVAFAVTTAGRLLKIDTASGAVTELIGRTVTLQIAASGYSPNPVAGSAFCVNGTGLADSAVSVGPPLPTSLGGLQMTLDGSALPLQAVAPGQTCFQLPWNTALGAHTLVAVTNSDLRFQGTPTTSLTIAYPSFANFLWLGPQYPVSVSLQPYPIAAHHDFSDFVTRANPARPGEIIHLYMTGLGPVNPPVPTGTAAPANPPAVAVTPPACILDTFRGSALPVPVLFAGLAPGFAGYYQVSLQLPAEIPVMYGDAFLMCTSGSITIGQSACIPILQQPCRASGIHETTGQRTRGCTQTHRLVGAPQ